jgi:predicted nucleic acid-binding protein
MGLTQTSQTNRVFIDSSVLYAAAYSVSGRAYDLITLGLRGDVPLSLSPLVLTETVRNITDKAPHVLPAFHALDQVLAPYLVAPSPASVRRAATLIHPKDAPIVAGALAARATYLATYDRRHLLNHAEAIRQALGILVMTPDDILRSLGQ